MSNSGGACGSGGSKYWYTRTGDGWCYRILCEARACTGLVYERSITDTWLQLRELNSNNNSTTSSNNSNSSNNTNNNNSNCNNCNISNNNSNSSNIISIVGITNIIIINNGNTKNKNYINNLLTSIINRIVIQV